MNLQTFKAATMAEALTQVKSAMGGDAVILHTRTFHTRYWLGLRRREMVEITAGKGFNVGNRRRQQPPPQAPPPQAAMVKAIGPRPSGSGNGGLATYVRAASGGPVPANTDLAPRNAMEGSRALLETPAANSAAFLSLTTEMCALKSM